MTQYDVSRLRDSFVGEVTGVSITSHPHSEAVAFVRDSWLKHKVLVFHDQSPTEQDLVEFSRQFGDLEIHVRREYLSTEHPELLYVSNIDQDGRRVGILGDTEVGWHYDQIYLPRPAVGSLLCAVKIPPVGAATYFADMSAAWHALPEDMQAKLAPLKATQSYEAFNRAYSVPTNKEQKNRTPDIEQPLVRTHPYTGEQALYLCPGMTTRIQGISEAESDELLEYLFEWTIRPEFVYQHDWQLGDCIMWDNACTMHRRDPFDGRYERLMKRTTILPEADVAVPF